MSQTTPVKLRADNVKLNYYNQRTKRDLNVLDGIDFSISEGELVSIVGPSGCGKSTFLAAVDGLVSIDGGKILIDGREVTKPGPDRGLVFQQDSLFPWRTVQRNVSYGLEIQKAADKEEIARRARTFVDLVGLAGFEDSYPNELSGGMRQRVNIARALAVDPELLLLDEPLPRSTRRPANSCNSSCCAFSTERKRPGFSLPTRSTRRSFFPTG